MPPNMRSVIGQLHRNSRSIGYNSQQARNFSAPIPGISSESKGAWWYIRRALAVAAGYGFLGPRLYGVKVAEREKKLKKYDEFFEKMSSIGKS